MIERGRFKSNAVTRDQPSSIGTQMKQALLALHRFCVIGLVFGTVLVSLGSENKIVIDVVDGKSGKPVPNEHILVFQGTTTEDVRAKKKSKDLQTDAHGVALLPLDDPSIMNIQVWVDWHVLCQEKPNNQSYSIEKIRQNGLSSPNNCGRVVRENNPNHLVVFARPAHFWEKMRY
jgi:hypothetical protein